MRNFIMVLASVLSLSTPTFADETVNVAVLSNMQSGNLILEIAGQGYLLEHTGWRQTSRGFETTTSFPRSLLFGKTQARLLREDRRGWSRWGRSEMRYLKSNDVHVSDPACVGGTAWCAARGL